MPNYHTLTWSQFDADTKELGVKLKALNKKWTTIVAIARGGLVPASILAHVFSIRHIDTVCVDSYDDETLQNHSMKVLKDFKSHSDEILVVDDLVDYGKTFQLVREMLPNAHFASVYAKPTGVPSTDTYVKLFTHDTWLVFPWEDQVEDNGGKSVVA